MPGGNTARAGRWEEPGLTAVADWPETLAPLLHSTLQPGRPLDVTRATANPMTYGQGVSMDGGLFILIGAAVLVFLLFRRRRRARLRFPRYVD